MNLIGDTPETIATAFALLINAGSTGVWAQSNGAVLTITARAMGTAGEAIPLSASPDAGAFTAIASNTALANGVDAKWLTDLAAVPRINRAARDWSTAYFQALKGYGIRQPVRSAWNLAMATTRWLRESRSAIPMAKRYG